MEAADERAVRALRASPVVEASDEIEVAIRHLPVVSVGQPETWPLPDLYPIDAMPPELRSKLPSADYFLSRFCCSFRPTDRRAAIEWARFWVRLIPDAAGRQPVGVDFFPREVTKETERDVRVTLSPSLSFSQVEASVGELAFGLKFAEIEPVVTASGAGEAAVDWSYDVAHGTQVRGSKWMYLLIKAPKSMASARAQLDVVADVTTPRGRLAAVLPARPEHACAELPAQLWG